MPKRKRLEDELEEKLGHHSKELFRMLKVAKGFERQRMAKRQRDPKSTPDKRRRIEKEIVVLKVRFYLSLTKDPSWMVANTSQSLDLQSVANAHLCASLLKVKALAESPKLPDEVKNGVPKPEISEEERALLHNVTSGLYNQTKVREVIDKAIADICRTLQVPVPDKKGKSKKGEKKAEVPSRKEPEEQPADQTKQSDKTAKRQKIENEKTTAQEAEQVGDEEEEWNGLSDAEEDEGNEEEVIKRFDDRLGSSESEDSGGDDEYDTANEELDPMEITDESASEQSDDEELSDKEDDESDEEGISGTDASEDSEDSEDDDEDDSDSSAVSPPPKMRKESKKAASTRVTDTKFLPSLMGGYVSGSESEASDIDVAPTARKNRRGQRARQAIWEKKFKEKAKHLEKEKSGRDAGWDLKRGAVDGSSSRTPWKQGIKTPFEKRSATVDSSEQAPSAEFQPKPQKKPPPKKDDEGPLHPSWEARKKAKEAQQTAAFSGKRVVFD